MLSKMQKIKATRQPANLLRVRFLANMIPLAFASTLIQY